jgi:hypothetical protein
VVIAGATYLFTDDAYASAQALNPAASTTDALRSSGSAVDATVGIARDLVSLFPPAAITLLVWDLAQPRGEFRYSQELYDRAVREGRNPFCAQCHGPGGALDPNSTWNRRSAFDLSTELGGVRQRRWTTLSPDEQAEITRFLGAPSSVAAGRTP